MELVSAGILKYTGIANLVFVLPCLGKDRKKIYFFWEEKEKMALGSITAGIAHTHTHSECKDR